MNPEVRATSAVPPGRLPPGPPYPRALQTLGWGLRPLSFLERCRQRYGDMFTLRIAHEGTWVMLADPELVSSVFTGDAAVLRAGEGNQILRPLVGGASVLLLDGAEHMRQRKLMLPAFHGERVQRYGELIVAATLAELERWPRGEPLALWPRMQSITLDVIVQAVFGITEQARVQRMRELLKGLLDYGTAPSNMLLLIALGPKRLERFGPFRRLLDPVDAAILEEARARREAPDLATREDVLSLLLSARDEDGDGLSDRELRDELVTLLVAGHETTATSLSWAIERLLRHPEQLERLRAEADAGGEEYADAVAKETLRLRPVLPIVVRRLSRPLSLGGYELPAGAAVTPCIHLIHRRADVYPEPRRFRPERFLERPAGTYTWIPFGGGVRRCIGASFAMFEMKQVLQTLVRNVDLRAPAEASERVVRRSITLTPGRGTVAVATPRRGAPAPPVGLGSRPAAVAA